MITDGPVATFAEKYGNEFMFLVQLAHLNTVEGQEFINQRNKFWYEHTEQILRADMKSARLTLDIDPKRAAHSLVAMVLGLLHWWMKDPGHAQRDRVVQSLTTLLPALYRNNSGSLS